MDNQQEEFEKDNWDYEPSWPWVTVLLALLAIVVLWRCAAP